MGMTIKDNRIVNKVPAESLSRGDIFEYNNHICMVTDHGTERLEDYGFMDIDDDSPYGFWAVTMDGGTLLVPDNAPVIPCEATLTIER